VVLHEGKEPSELFLMGQSVFGPPRREEIGETTNIWSDSNSWPSQAASEPGIKPKNADYFFPVSQGRNVET